MTAKGTERSRDRVQSIERGMAVLRAFDARNGQLSTSDIAAQVGLPRPVVRRILLTFEHLGYVRGLRVGGTSRRRILELGAAYFADSSLPVLARAAMDDVVEDAAGDVQPRGAQRHRRHTRRARRGPPPAPRIGAGRHEPPRRRDGGRQGPACGSLRVRPRDLPRRGRLGAAHRAHHPGCHGDARIGSRSCDSRDTTFRSRNSIPAWSRAAVPIVINGATVAALAVSSTTFRQDESSLTRDAVPVLRAAADRIARGYLGSQPAPVRRASPESRTGCRRGCSFRLQVAVSLVDLVERVRARDQLVELQLSRLVQRDLLGHVRARVRVAVDRALDPLLEARRARAD